MDINDDFFNDICYPYSENNSNTDVVLEDRVNDIYQNYSICDSNCEYEKINIEYNLIECNCTIKTNTSIDENQANFAEMVKYSFKNSNFAIFKCVKLVFNSKIFTTNLGFWLFF